MDQTKTNPLVVVTGASSGIGAATARRFAKGHFPLALLARRLDRLEQLKKELTEDTFVYQLDVADSARVEEVVEQIEQEAGPIGVLVNNAGISLDLEPAYEGKKAEWDQCVDINIKGLLYCTRAVLPRMVERNVGQIVNMGSIAGHYPYPGGNIYGATKAFVHQFSLNLRADLLGKNIRVNCIEPGMVGGSEFSVVRFRGDAERAKNVYAKVQPLVPEDIAELVYFCCTLPPHVNLNVIEVMPVMQASAPLAVHRNKE